jgi:hypothetical protein
MAMSQVIENDRTSEVAIFVRLIRMVNDDSWMNRWPGSLFGRTAIGRTTIVALAMNDPDVIRVRRSLIEEGLFPRVD